MSLTRGFYLVYKIINHSINYYIKYDTYYKYEQPQYYIIIQVTKLNTYGRFNIRVQISKVSVKI